MPAVNYLKYLRIQKNVSKSELAEFIKRSTRTVEAYEKNTVKVPLEMAEIMASFFNLDTPENLTGFIRKIHVSEEEYKRILPNFPIVLSNRPTTIFDLLNIQKRKISLKDCHALILNKRMAIPNIT